MQLSKEQFQAIQKAKEEAGKTYDQLADELHISKSQVQRYFTGATKAIPAATVRDLCAAVGLDPQQIGLTEHGNTGDELMRIVLPALEARHREEIERLTDAMEAQIAYKNRWIRALSVIVWLLMLFIMSLLIIDILHPDTGWIRRLLFNMKFTEQMF